MHHLDPILHAAAVYLIDNAPDATRHNKVVYLLATAGMRPLRAQNEIAHTVVAAIDLSQLNIALANATHPLPNMGRSLACVRDRGKGRRRHNSKSHVSRPSVYETIEEEVFCFKEGRHKKTPNDIHRRFRHNINSFERGGVGLG